MAKMFPWQGDELCKGTIKAGLPCSNPEIEGLEFCLQHVPDDMLEEAEDITGRKRCRTRFGEPEACRNNAVAHTDPPACKVHGANIGSNTRKAASVRSIENDALDQLRRIMDEDEVMMALTQPDPIANPLDALLELAAEIRALRLILRDRVMQMNLSEWRYSKSGVGEQVRAELLLYERAQEREAHILIQISKLNIAERLAAIDESQMRMIERALNTALQASGVDLLGQETARVALVRELKAGIGG